MLIFWKAKEKRIAALEIITESILNCEAGCSTVFVEGLCAMAWELGLISKKEWESFSQDAQAARNSAE